MPERRPSFPFYPKDWLASTRGLSGAARGYHVDLLALAWLNGGCDTDPELLRRSVGADKAEWRRVWPELAPRWREVNGRLVHARLEQVREEATAYTEAKRLAGRKGGKATAHGKQTASTPTGKPTAGDVASGVAETKPSSASALAVASAKQHPPTPKGELFDRFWQAYPNGDDKVAARKAWAKLTPDEALLDAMLAAITWQARTDQWQRGIIPHAATWLNHRRWEDEPTGRTSGAASTSVPVVDPDYRGKPYRFHCPHTPPCVSWPQCRDAARAGESRTA